MSIQRFFSDPADISGSDIKYRALYTTLYRACEEGLDGILYLSEDVAPILSICNCVKTIETHLSSNRYSAKTMTEVIDQMEINPLGFNPPVSEIKYHRYSFDIPSSFGKQMVMICLEALLLFDGPTYCPALKEIKHFNKLQGISHEQATSFLSAYVREYVRLQGKVDQKTRDFVAPLSQPRPHRYISIDRLFAVAGNLYREHPEQAELFSEVIYASIQEEAGSDLERARARARQLIAIVSSPAAMATAARTAEENEKGELATTSQLALLFHYLFDYLGVNYGNSDKTAWARLIHWITGRSEDNIRKRLCFNFDNKTVKRDLKVVASYLKELFPAISQQIEKDSEE